MKIELKNIKIVEAMSEETNCFNATVYIDGIKAGQVSNEGCGGCNRYQPYALQDTINDYAKTLPPLDISDWGLKDKTMSQSDETIIGDLLEAHLNQKHLDKLCKKGIVCHLPGKKYEKGEYSTFTLSSSKRLDVRTRDAFLKQYPGAIIFNKLLDQPSVSNSL